MFFYYFVFDKCAWIGIISGHQQVHAMDSPFTFGAAACRVTAACHPPVSTNQPPATGPQPHVTSRRPASGFQVVPAAAPATAQCHRFSGVRRLPHIEDCQKPANQLYKNNFCTTTE
jgi:hypothetical protein